MILDVTDPASVLDAVRAVEDEDRGLESWVNNAGRIVAAPATETTVEIMATVFATNVFGAVELTTACLPLPARSASARIVNVSSTTAHCR